LIQQGKRPELAKDSAGGQGCYSWRNRQQGPPSEHTRRPSRAASAPHTSHQSPIPLRNRADPGGQKGPGMFDDANPPAVLHSLCAGTCAYPPHPGSSPLSGEPPSTTAIGWTGLLTYNAYAAPERVADRADCTACSAITRRPFCFARSVAASHRQLGVQKPGLLRRHSCLGAVGAVAAVGGAKRRLGEVDPGAFGGNPRCGDNEQQVPPWGCGGRGRRHLKEYCLGAGQLDGQIH